MTRILFSAAGGLVTPGIVSHLKAAGHIVIGFDASEYAAGRSFCDEFYISPMVREEKLYFDFLNNLHEKFDIFFPFLDEELFLFAQNMDKVPSPVRKKLFISTAETIKTCVDKSQFQNLIETHGLPIAPSVTTPPAIAKPVFGRGSRDIHNIQDQKYLDLFKNNPDYVIQKNISGEEYTVDVLTNKNGGWIAGVARKRLHAKGVSTLGQIDMAEDIMAAARQCVDALEFRGPINIQIIRDEETKKPYLIEINPRISGSIEFTRRAGFDLIQTAIDLFEGQTDLPDPQIKDGLVIGRYYQEIEHS